MRGEATSLRLIAVSATIPNISDVHLLLTHVTLPESSLSFSLFHSSVAGWGQRTILHWNTSTVTSHSMYGVLTRYCVCVCVCACRRVDECHRPVRLRKVVLSYPSSTSDFKFNLSLNYRLSSVIHTYSDQKPCLVVYPIATSFST